jgi:hypothetical protein
MRPADTFPSRAVALGLVSAAVAISGCGALPPQAPLQYAKKLDSATSGISTACGYAYRATAFPGNHARVLEKLEDAASGAARKLANVFHRDRHWVYQGYTVAEISSDAVSMLSSCGLHAAATQLKEATTAS